MWNDTKTRWPPLSISVNLAIKLGWEKKSTEKMDEKTPASDR